MNRIELEQLRGFAIEHLPAAQKLRENMKACPAEDRESQLYEMRLYNIADDIIVRKESTAAELAAASLLMKLVAWEIYDPVMLPAMNKINIARGNSDLGDMPNALLPGIAEAAKLLAKLTSQKIPFDLKPAYAPVPERIPVSKQQETEILSWLTSNNHNPLELPIAPSGKAGVKSECRKVLCMRPTTLFSSKSTFNKAWDRLRFNRAIKDAEK